MSGDRYVVDVGDITCDDDYQDVIDARDEYRQQRGDAAREVRHEEAEDRNAWRRIAKAAAA